jgi:predicted PurR-regulated permease PerM
LALLVTHIGWILIIPVLSVFFLLGRAALSASVLQLINASHERRILRSVFADLDLMLAQYIRAQVFLTLLAAIAYTGFLEVIRMPYALAIGPIAGLLEFIPLVGPLLAGISMLAIAFGTGFGHWIPIVLFWLIWRGVQDYYNMPHLMRRELELPPLLAVTSVLAGGEIAGILGMFLSIPAVGVIRVIWRNTIGRKGYTSRPQDEDTDAVA